MSYMLQFLSESVALPFCPSDILLLDLPEWIILECLWIYAFGGLVRLLIDTTIGSTALLGICAIVRRSFPLIQSRH